MPEVLEIEQVEVEETAEIIEPNWNSWTIVIPQEIIQAQGLTEGSLVNLFYEDGEIKSQLIVPSVKLNEISKRILEKNREAFEELKRLGD